jgi:hypothetical protein
LKLWLGFKYGDLKTFFNGFQTPPFNSGLPEYSHTIIGVLPPGGANGVALLLPSPDAPSASAIISNQRLLGRAVGGRSPIFQHSG